jgi:hypothetical protein
MDELELLKKDWDTSKQNYPNLNKEEIYKLISKRSSSIVKWIFIISILEFSLWTILSFFAEGTTEFQQKIRANDYGFIYYTIIGVSYIIILVFMYLFYKNYRSISVTENTKVLMEQILKTRKTVKYYVIYNLAMMCLSIPIAVIMELSSPESQTLISEIQGDGDKGIYIFYLIVAVLSLIVMAVVTAFFLGFYYLIYGLLLKRLKKNHKELKKLEDAL